MEKKRAIRAYKEGDETEILRLSRAVYPDKSEDAIEALLRHARWIDESPAGAGLVNTWLMEEGRILGQYRLLWMDLKFGNGVSKAAQGVDAMTDPDHRRQGIIYALGKHATVEAAKNGVQIGFGFLKRASANYYAQLKSGWFLVGTMQLWFKPLHWENVIRLKVSDPRLAMVFAMGAKWLFDRIISRTRNSLAQQGLRIKQVTSFDERISPLWARVSDRYTIMVVRSQRYLNWRYASPGQNYRIFVAEKSGEVLGYVILRRQTTHGIMVTCIFDLLAQSDEVMHALISKAVEDSRLGNADLVFYPLIADKSHCKVLKRNGFVSLPFVESREFVAYRYSPLVSKSFLRDSRNWFVQAGDSDKY